MVWLGLLNLFLIFFFQVLFFSAFWKTQVYVLMQIYFNITQSKVNTATSAELWLETPHECSVGTSVCIAWIKDSALNKETSITFGHSKLLFHLGAVENTA